MSASKALFYILLAFIFGVFISSFWPPLFFISLSLISFLFLTLSFILISFSFLKEKRNVFVLAICLIFIVLGIFRMELAKKEEIQLTKISPPNYLGFYTLKEKLKNLIFENFSPPYSSILMGITFGDKRGLSLEWKEKFNKTGLSHIIAVSGLHIIVLTTLLGWVSLFCGLYRHQGFYFVLCGLWFFIFLTSFQASAIRAGIMGSIFLIGQKLGQISASLRALIFTGALMLLLNPLLLKFNLGFQFSFMATLGLISLAPYLENFFSKVKLLKFLNLSFLLAATFSAQIFLFPLLVYYFETFSIVAPLTNILVIPLLPCIMALTILFFIFGLIFTPLSFLISWLIHLFLYYLIFIVNFFIQLPFSFLSLKISEFFIFLYYLILFLIIFYLQKRKKESFFLSFKNF